jgi:hypothetical protein
MATRFRASVDSGVSVERSATITIESSVREPISAAAAIR